MQRSDNVCLFVWATVVEIGISFVMVFHLLWSTVGGSRCDLVSLWVTRAGLVASPAVTGNDGVLGLFCAHCLGWAKQTPGIMRRN